MRASSSHGTDRAWADLNTGVLRYLAPSDDPATVGLERPDETTDTWRLGAHPDVVEWLWTRLNAALPEDGRHLVADTATLAHPTRRVILAVALGTRYALRFTLRRTEAARSAGYASQHHFATVGRSLDLEATFGPGWVFGRYGADEGAWLAEAYHAADADNREPNST